MALYVCLLVFLSLLQPLMQSLSSSLKQSWLICSAQAMLAAVVIVFLAPYQMCCARDSKEEPDKDSPPAEA